MSDWDPPTQLSNAVTLLLGNDVRLTAKLIDETDPADLARMGDVYEAMWDAHWQLWWSLVIFKSRTEGHTFFKATEPPKKETK